MARHLGLLLLVVCGCLYPWDHSDTSTTGEGISSTTAPPGSSSGDTTGGMPASSGSDSDGMHTSSGDTSGASTTDGTSTDMTTATTGPAPFCGDGAINAPGEECDDGNDDPNDGCDGACARARLVFATSETFDPKMLGGLAVADGICRQLAGKAGLPNKSTYSAWLSDSKADALDRVFHGRGRYLRVDGLLVADSFDALLAGPLLAPIASDEYGQPAPGGAWTGTLPDGTAVPGAWHCADWTSDDFSEFGHFGAVESVDTSWTFLMNPELNPGSCAESFHLYCFEGK